MLQRCKHNHYVHILFLLRTMFQNLITAGTGINLKNSRPGNPPGHVSIPGFLITSKRIPRTSKGRMPCLDLGFGTKKLQEKPPWKLCNFPKKWYWYTRARVRWYMMTQLLRNLVLALYEPSEEVDHNTTTTTVFPVPSGLVQCAQSALFALPHHSI